MDRLKSDPTQVSNLLNSSIDLFLKEDQVSQLVDTLNLTKQMIHSLNTSEELLSLSDELNQLNFVFSHQQGERIVQEMPQLMMVPPDIEMKQAILGYLFFPHDLIQGHVSNIILFSKLEIHYQLAISASYGYPLAYIYFATLLHSFEIFDNKIETYERKAISAIEKLSHPCQKAFCYFHLDMFDEAKDYLTKDSTPLPRHPFFTYLYAQILETDSEKTQTAFEIYQEIAEYPEASFQLAFFQDSEAEQFHHFLKAAEGGVLEGYVRIGELIQAGYQDIDPKDNTLRTAEDWLRKAADQGSINGFLSLGDIYEASEQWQRALDIYQQISDEGFLIGHLKKGQIFENQTRYEKAKQTYQQAKWQGLHKLVEMNVYEEDEDLSRQIKEQKVHHFESLIKITEGSTENKNY